MNLLKRHNFFSMNNIRNLAKHAFNKYPITSNSIIYGTLCVGAEFSQQTVNKKVLDKSNKPYEIASLARYSVYGTMLGGPLLTVWYRFLDKKLIGTATKTVVKKVIVDQFFFTPQLLIVFFIAMSAMEKRPDIFEECKEKFVQTFKTSCAFWLPAQSFNFFVVPPAFRVVYVGTCSFAWVNILCWIKRQ